VSHELRSPLNGIASNVQMMEMGLCGPLSEGQARALERIGRAQGHLLGLITQILDYKKLTVGGPQYDLARVSAATALADAATLVESEIERRGLRLERGDDGRAIAVLADPGKLRQILVNLLANAVKFTPSGGVVTLAAEDGGPRVCFHVRDTGAGIPGDALERIFEPFVQLRQSPMTAASGTGLGLAISRELARGMGGDLTVQSAVGAGSTFTLHLPAAPPDP
jgi:signal transduction histidine kinase